MDMTTINNLEEVQLLKMPRALTAELHEHQVTGVSWMVQMFNNGMSMILGDQMGLGKTLQSFAFISYLRYAQRQTGPFLVVMPLSVLSNWMAEFERYESKITKTIKYQNEQHKQNNQHCTLT